MYDSHICDDDQVVWFGGVTGLVPVEDWCLTAQTGAMYKSPISAMAELCGTR